MTPSLWSQHIGTGALKHGSTAGELLIITSVRSLGEVLAVAEQQEQEEGDTLAWDCMVTGKKCTGWFIFGDLHISNPCDDPPRGCQHLAGHWRNQVFSYYVQL